MPPVFSATSYAELERFIQKTLCEHERYDPDQTVLKKTAVRQAGQVIGLMLRVEGGQSHRSHAVWAETENRILFYNSAGQRFGEVQLAESPDLQSVPLRAGTALSTS